MVEVNVNLGNKHKLKSKFKFRYPLSSKPLSVSSGCGCTNHSYEDGYLVFTVETPSEIPFQISDKVWEKTITSVVHTSEDDIKINIKYGIVTNLN